MLLFLSSNSYQLRSWMIRETPAVNTDLEGIGLHTFGVPLDEFADGV
jgi:hypothetical protein